MQKNWQKNLVKSTILQTAKKLNETYPDIEYATFLRVAYDNSVGHDFRLTYKVFINDCKNHELLTAMALLQLYEQDLRAFNVQKEFSDSVRDDKQILY